MTSASYYAKYMASDLFVDLNDSYPNVCFSVVKHLVLIALANILPCFLRQQNLIFEVYFDSLQTTICRIYHLHNDENTLIYD